MRHLLLLLIALLSLSTSPLWVRWADAPLVLIGWWRLSLAAAATGLIGGWTLRKSLDWQAAAKSPWAWVAGFLFFVHLATYMKSAQTTSVAHLVLLFSSAPLFTALGSFIFFQDPFPRRLWGVYFLALMGVLLLFSERLDFRPDQWEGDLWAVASAALHAGYVLAGKKARQRIGTTEFTTLLYGSSALCFLVWILGTEGPVLPTTAHFWGAVLGLVLFPSLLGHSLYGHLLKHLNINLLSCAKLIEPGFASLMALWFLGEPVTGISLVAYALMASAILLLLGPGVDFHLKPVETSPAKK